MRSRVVIHVDMNAYFASIEQKANPLLRGKPLVVVGDTKRRSVVMTASYEARKYGIKTGMNLYEARQLYPRVIAVDGNSEKYLDSTAKIIAILESFTDQVEVFSCDEAWLDVTASQRYFGMDGAGIASRIQEKIKNILNLPCSVGVAPNKLLAKLASEQHKPEGLTVIRPESVAAILAETPIEALCGIGDRLKKKLNQLGIHTCKELGEADQELLIVHFGFWGHWLKRMGHGIDESTVRRLSDKNDEEKSVSNATTFPRDTDRMEILQSYLLVLSEKIACRLRRARLEGKTVSLFVRYKDFSSYAKQRALGSPTDDGYRIYREALNLLTETLPLRQSIRLLGVRISSLTPTTFQEFLFEAMNRKNNLNETVDAINRKMGERTIKPAAFLHAESFGILSAPIPPSRPRY